MRTTPLALLLATITLATHTSAQTFTLDHYANVARVSDVRVAPQGDRAIMLVAWSNFEGNTWDAEIVEVTLATKAMRTLTQRKTTSSPRWSPSGDRLAFLATVDGKTQLFVLPVSGGDAKQVTRSVTGVGTFAWNPDGSAFAYTALEAPATKGRFDDAFEVNGNDYLTQSAPRSVQLWSVNADGTDARTIARGTWSIPSLFSTLVWSADGTSIVFTKQDAPGTREWEKRTLAVASVATGALSAVRGVPIHAASSQRRQMAPSVPYGKCRWAVHHVVATSGASMCRISMSPLTAQSSSSALTRRGHRRCTSCRRTRRRRNV